MCRCKNRSRLETMSSLPIGLIVLLVLMALCAILGIIYSYIYFTKISPPGRCSAGQKSYGGISSIIRSSSNVEDQTGGATGGTGSGAAVGTHLFLFRKS